jgi:hypothetical protein
MTEKTGKPTDRQQDEWQQDLNPDPMAGQNFGIAGSHPEKAALSAYDVKELHQHLKEFTNDELRQITLLPHGSRLEQNATYLDLMDEDRQPFTAMGDMEATPEHWYVPKTEVDYLIWNRLTGKISAEEARQSTSA